MTLFANQNLFASGPHRFTVGGLELKRTVETHTVGRGVAMTAGGVGGRDIVQEGTLVADTPGSLQRLIAEIESLLDGQPHDLVDAWGTAHRGVVMVKLTVQEMQRLGMRYRCDYRIDYLQVNP